MKFMETMQDKLVREKLNSLDTLPEGYMPSLDSKWELLMAGQPQKQEPKRYLWYAAAASFLLLLAFGFLFLKPAEQPATGIIAKAPVSDKNSTPSTLENHQPASQISQPENAIAYQRKTAIAVNTEPKSIAKNAMVKALK